MPKETLTLLVYRANNLYWITLLGGPGFKSKEEVFLDGTEEEVFSISNANRQDMPFLELIKEVIGEADRRHIDAIHGLFDLFDSRGNIIFSPKKIDHSQN